MGSILAIDLGDRRVGTALADLSSRIALPHKTFERDKAEGEILALIKERSVEVVVVGVPLDEDGNRTPQCDKSEKFGRRIERRAAVKVEYVEEYLTTFDAKQRLEEMGLGERAARESGVLDAVAASIILETYLLGDSKGQKI